MSIHRSCCLPHPRHPPATPRLPNLMFGNHPRVLSDLWRHTCICVPAESWLCRTTNTHVLLSSWRTYSMWEWIGQPPCEDEVADFKLPRKMTVSRSLGIIRIPSGVALQDTFGLCSPNSGRQPNLSTLMCFARRVSTSKAENLVIEWVIIFY